MIIRVKGNQLPALRAGDVLFARFKLSLATCLDYFLSTLIRPRIYIHVALVIKDFDPAGPHSDESVIIDAVKRRMKAKGKNVALRPMDNFLRNMKVLYIGRLRGVSIEANRFDRMLQRVRELSEQSTEYSMINYKCPDIDPPSFSCYGLVEYCYELLGMDLVSDDNFVGKQWLGLPGIPCFRPGHLYKAFKSERYAFRGDSVL